MGFYATASEDRAGKSGTHPLKNRVMGLDAFSFSGTGSMWSETQCSRPENHPTVTTTASGMRFWGYRFYSPGLGRWVNRDPIEEEGGVNLYHYVYNAGVNSYDLLGMLSANGLFPNEIPRRMFPSEFSSLKGVHLKACQQLEQQIRSFCPSDKDKRAWDRFTSGTEKDVDLNNQEIDNLVNLSSKYLQHIDSLMADCAHKGAKWENSVHNVSDDIGHPWSVAIGRTTLTINSSCCNGCLRWNVAIEDRFDFNIELLENPFLKTSRTPANELKTIMVRAAQEASRCGWREFYHRGNRSFTSGLMCTGGAQ